MNVYQKVIFSKVKLSVNVGDATVTLVDKTITLKQSENAYIESYVVTLESPAISSIVIGTNEFKIQTRLNLS